jgi:Flp pilus assembly protein TadD
VDRSIRRPSFFFSNCHRGAGCANQGTMTNLKSLDGDTASIIRQALAAAQSGDIQRACTSPSRAAERRGHRRAERHARRAALPFGRPRSRRDPSPAALDLQPQDLTIATNLAAALVEQGDHEAALEVATRERATADETLRLARFRGFAAQSPALSAGRRSL